MRSDLGFETAKRIQTDVPRIRVAHTLHGGQSLCLPCGVWRMRNTMCPTSVVFQVRDSANAWTLRSNAVMQTTSASRVLQLHDMETNASVMHVIVTDDYGLLSSTLES